MDIRKIHQALAGPQPPPGPEAVRRAGEFVVALTRAEAFWVWDSAAGSFVVGAPQGSPGAAWVKEHAGDLVAEAKRAADQVSAACLRAGVPQRVCLLTPLPEGTGSSGVLGVVLDLAPSDAPEPYLVILQLAVARLMSSGDRAAETVQLQPPTEVRWARWMRAALGAVAAEKPMDLFAAAVRSDLGCAHVAISWKTWRGWTVAGLTDRAAWLPRSPIWQALSGAAREVARARARVSGGDAEAPAHGEAAQALGMSLVSWPVVTGAGGGVEAVLHLLGDATAEPVSADEVEAVSGLVRRSRESAAGDAWFSFFRAGRWADRSRRRRDLMMLAILALVPVPHPVWVPARVEPVMRRVVAAPFEGRLASSLVRPGDLVKEGQVLAELDGREWAMREAELVAGRDRSLKLRDQALALAGEDPVSLQAAQLEADQLEMELQQILFRTSNLQVRAPVAGTVIEGDLDRAQGVPVRQGQTLFVLAPLDQMLLQLEVPQHQVSRVLVGRGVWARVHSQPAHLWRGGVTRVFPQVELKDGRSFFVAEAALDVRVSLLKPGMAAKAIVWCPPKPVVWILFHRVFERILTLGW